MVATLARVDCEEPGDHRGNILDIDGLRMRVHCPYGIGKPVHASASVTGLRSEVRQALEPGESST